MFLREHRHELFDEQFQAELAGAFATGRRAAAGAAGPAGAGTGRVEDTYNLERPAIGTCLVCRNRAQARSPMIIGLPR